MKTGISALALSFAVGAVAAPAAFAQTSTATAQPAESATRSQSEFARNRYTAVTERAQSEFDPEPIRLGVWNLNTSLDLGAHLNDNVYAQNSGEVEDTVITVRPQVDIASNWSVHQIAAGLFVDHREYLNEDTETATDYRAYARGHLDVTRDFWLSGQVDAGKTTEGRYEPASAGSPDPAEYDTLGLALAGRYTRDRFQFEVRGGQNTYEFNTVQSYRDVTDTYGIARVAYAVTPAIAVFLDAQQSELEYDNAPLRDATRTTLRVGANFELDAPFRGDIAIGQTKEDRDDPLAEDADGVSADARLMWFITQLTTVTFTGSRQAYDPGLVNASTAFDTHFGVRADHELLRNVLLFASVDAGKREFEDITREDETLNLSLGVAYKLNKKVHLQAALQRLSQDSDLPGDTFDQNMFSVGLKFYP